MGIIQGSINSIIASLAGTAKLAKIASKLELNDLVEPKANTKVAAPTPKQKTIDKDVLTKQNIIPRDLAVNNAKKKLRKIIEAREMSYNYIRNNGRVNAREALYKKVK